MTRKTYQTQTRLHVASELPWNSGCVEALSKPAVHYLRTVLRLSAGDTLIIFNQEHGEWLVEISEITKNAATVMLKEQLRTPESESLIDVWLCFAPVKNAPMANIVQKATELGITCFQPIITARTNTSRVNLERIEKNAIEASEQCARLRIPEVSPPLSLKELLGQWDVKRQLIWCDETGGGAPIIDALKNMPKKGSYAVLVGPEGGFSEEELAYIGQKKYVTAVGLGPRILRADTAVISALTCVQAVLGDWHKSYGN